MISNFFVLSPRGDTVIAKQYRNDRGDAGAHERSHTEAFFRKIKFWDSGSNLTPAGGEDASNKPSAEGEPGKRTGDAPPVFMMPDGLTYIHVKRNGLIFGCATARNASPVTIIEVSLRYATDYVLKYCIPRRNFRIPENLIFLIHDSCRDLTHTISASFDHCTCIQGLLRNAIRGSNKKKLHPTLRTS